MAMAFYWQHVYQGQELKQLYADSRQLNAQQSKRLSMIEDAVQEISRRIPYSQPQQHMTFLAPADISALEAQMSQLSIVTSGAAKEHDIIKSLNPDRRPARYSTIPDAHSATFRWVFEDSYDSDSSHAAGSVFRWLAHGDDIFWISGKPGSGKSTLMKYIVDDRRTLQALRIWSNPMPVVVASHSFWSAGTLLQKSRQGLMQTLLYDIFRQQPDLIERFCVERWSKNMHTLKRELWEPPELVPVLERISECNNLATKFCFFIDGLDEFEGDHVEFCRALRKLSMSPHIKLCVSSRPWNIFEDSFGHDLSSKFYIHELTRNDIHAYVQNSLQEHPRWTALDTKVPNAGSMIDEITRRAAGVFLWVFLVTKQLRSGLTEYDSFSDLQRRLESIPDDLGSFFHQILDSVDSFYHLKMASTLQIALATREPAAISIYSFQEMEYEDADYALKAAFGTQNTEQTTSNHAIMTRRLNARCRGLLEVNPQNKCVEFLHRTVMDYLRTQRMAEYLQSKVDPTFNADLSLLKAFTAYIKKTDFPGRVDRTGFAEYTPSLLMHAVEEAVFHASKLDSVPKAYQLLEELERCVPEMHRSRQAMLNFMGDPPNPDILFVREPIVAASLVGYLGYVKSKVPDYFSNFEVPPLAEVSRLCLIDQFKLSHFGPRMEMIRFLLECGHDPNEMYYDKYNDVTTTPWTTFFSTALDLCHETQILEIFLQSGIFSLFLRHGADPTIEVNPAGDVSWISFAYRLLSVYLTPRNQELSLEAMDDFKAAYAHVCHPLTSALYTALERFFDRLAKESNFATQKFFAKITERLLSAAKIHGAEVRNYLPVIEEIFPRAISIRIWNGDFGILDNAQTQIPKAHVFVIGETELLLIAEISYVLV